jgi:hypothetical protein
MVNKNFLNHQSVILDDVFCFLSCYQVLGAVSGKYNIVSFGLTNIQRFSRGRARPAPETRCRRITLIEGCESLF